MTVKTVKIQPNLFFTNSLWMFEHVTFISEQAPVLSRIKELYLINNMCIRF